MKKVLASFLMLLIFAQLVVHLGVYLSWKVNQEYLTKTACVNRNVKGSCCHAKCQLNKRMNKVDQSEQPNDSKKSTTNKFSEVEAFVLNEVSVSIKDFYLDENEIRNEKMYHFIFSNKHILEVFHPPANFNC